MKKVEEIKNTDEKKNKIQLFRMIDSLEIKPTDDGFIPLLLCAVCASLSLVMQITDRFIFPFGNGLLSPLISQIIIFFIPTYLCLILTSYGKSASAQLKFIGFGKLRAEYIFFMIFAAFFMMSTSFLLNSLFYGIYKASEGFTLLGIFTAGANEYTVSYPYLILTYAIFPALIEECLFRGLIYRHLEGVGEGVAILLSSLLSAVFAFTLGGFVAALFTAVLYCFIRYITRSLQACIAVHFAFNLFALFIQTNLSKYALSSQNNFLFFFILSLVWLITAILFFSECARIFKNRAKSISDGKESSSLPHLELKKTLGDVFSALSYRPSLICFIVILADFTAIVIIGALT